MLILPSKTVPQYLKNYVDPEKQCQAQFLVGYQHIITQKGWTLIKNQHKLHCTRSFNYLLKSNLQGLNQTIKQGQILEKIDNNYILLDKTYNKRLIKKIQGEEIQKLIKQIQLENNSNDRKICQNIIMNCFDQYKDYQQSVGWWINLNQTKGKQLTIGEKFIQDYNYKNIQGEKLFEVPLYNKQTGNWDTNKTIALKIHQ